MEKLLYRTSAFFVKYGDALEINRDIYEYGIIIVLSTFMNLAITLAIGLILKIPYRLAAYAIPFIILRSSAGGYHAKTFWGCIAASSFTLLAVVSLILHTPDSYYLLLTALFNIVSGGIILLFAPVIHQKRTIDRSYFLKLKLRSLSFTALSFIAELLFFLLNMKVYMFCISASLLATSILLLPGAYTKRKIRLQIGAYHCKT